MPKISKKWIFVAILVLSSFLRLYQISKVPVSLFGDELEVGYQAYSVLKTGRDYYGDFMPLHFHSLAEWRTPLYLYSAVPTVAIFGISPLGVRLPAAIFGILGVVAFYFLLKVIREEYMSYKSSTFELLGMFFLAISPWHIQYSRAGFEVTQLLFFLMVGIYLFLKTISAKKGKGKLLWISGVCFAAMPWVYSTAKMFTPFLLLFLLIVWRKEIFTLPRKYLAYTCIALFVVGAPIAYSTIFGGGADRFGYVGVFTDPTIEPEIGTAREIEAKMRGETGVGVSPTLKERVFNNKFAYVGNEVLNHYFDSLSSDFLFYKGDTNPRHSIEGMGEFYKIEIITMLLGIAFMYGAKFDKKIKYLIVFWILAGVFPAALTRDGGTHATRLILILPPLMFLVTLGFYQTIKLLKGRSRAIFIVGYFVGLAILFLSYQNLYWVHNPWQSERWWHYGWQQAIQSIKDNESHFDKVVISTSDEPPWVFFAAWYEYPPRQWQQNFPLDNKVNLDGFGEVSHVGKFYFGSPELQGVYDWGKVMDKDTLYLASAKEVGPNLVMEPGRTPPDLNLIKAISYPSGEPAFYLFSKK